MRLGAVRVPRGDDSAGRHRADAVGVLARLLRGGIDKLEVQAAKQPESAIDSVKHSVFVAGPRARLQQAENTGTCQAGLLPPGAGAG